MKYAGTLIAVKDMEISKRFYHDVLGLDVAADFGANVMLDGGIFLQTLDTWELFIRTDNVILQNNAGEMYFEEEDIDAFSDHLKSFEINYVHELLEHPWGQRVVRFYDPDGHIIEVGEMIKTVIERFLKSGMTHEEVAKRMDVPVEYVRNVIGF
ncbi:MAG: VOC family protein [Coriobacteriales bacterium]|nr:VOC family protein [Coriobacteriales bacterium]